jgi:5-hydroxyisourate hydrolase-like protein (transthyretin family)
MWRICGRVVNSEGRPVSDVQVQVFRPDFVFDDWLRTVGTDENGCFEVVYREEEGLDLLEAGPDLYVRVMDQDGNQLSRSPRVQYEAGKDIRFSIGLN